MRVLGLRDVGKMNWWGDDSGTIDHLICYNFHCKVMKGKAV